MLVELCVFMVLFKVLFEFETTEHSLWLEEGNPLLLLQFLRSIILFFH